MVTTLKPTPAQMLQVKEQREKKCQVTGLDRQQQTQLKGQLQDNLERLCDRSHQYVVRGTFLRYIVTSFYDPGFRCVKHDTNTRLKVGRSSNNLIFWPWNR